MDDDVQALVAEQIGYYRAHAPDYDHDIAGLHPGWSQAIDELPIAGDVLKLAGGSGRWTPLLAARACSVTAVDAAPEMLAMARQRIGNLPVSSSRRMCSPGSRRAATTPCSWPSGSFMSPRPLRGLLVHGGIGPGTGRAGLLPGRQQPRTCGRKGRG